jgi:hypothetical protein
VTKLAPEDVHDLSNALEGAPCVSSFAIPDPPVQAFNVAAGAPTQRQTPSPMMKPPIFDATRMTARPAIQTPNCMVVCLDGDHPLLQAREDLLRLGQCQSQPRDLAEVTERSDSHYFDDPRRAVDPGFDQAQDPPDPRIPSQQTVGQSYRLRPHTPTFWPLSIQDWQAAEIGG